MCFSEQAENLVVVEGTDLHCYQVLLEHVVLEFASLKAQGQNDFPDSLEDGLSHR